MNHEYTKTLYGIEMLVKVDYEIVVDPSYGDQQVISITNLEAENSSGYVIDVEGLYNYNKYSETYCCLYDELMEDAYYELRGV